MYMYRVCSKYIIYMHDFAFSYILTKAPFCQPPCSVNRDVIKVQIIKVLLAQIASPATLIYCVLENLDMSVQNGHLTSSV